MRDVLFMVMILDPPDNNYRNICVLYIFVMGDRISKARESSRAELGSTRLVRKNWAREPFSFFFLFFPLK